MKTEKRLTMALSVLVALMMLAVPLASSSNLFVDGGQTNSNGDAPVVGAAEDGTYPVSFDLSVPDNSLDKLDFDVIDINIDTAINNLTESQKKAISTIYREDSKIIFVVKYTANTAESSQPSNEVSASLTDIFALMNTIIGFDNTNPGQVVNNNIRYGYDISEWNEGKSSYALGDANATDPIREKHNFTAKWDKKDNFGYYDVKISIDNDDKGTFVKAYAVTSASEEKQIDFTNSDNEVISGDMITGFNNLGYVVNISPFDDGGEISEHAGIRNVYSLVMKDNTGTEIKDTSKVIVTDDLSFTVTATLNDIFKKITVSSIMFEEPIVLYAWNGADYSYNDVWNALTKPYVNVDGKTETDDIYTYDTDGKVTMDVGEEFPFEPIKVADLDKNQKTYYTVPDQDYVISGWNEGVEYVNSTRNAGTDLTLDAEPYGYKVVFMVNGEYEIVNVLYGGKLSADLTSLTIEGVDHWSTLMINNGSGDSYCTDMSKWDPTLATGSADKPKGIISEFKFNVGTIGDVEDAMDNEDAVAFVLIACFESIGDTAYAVFDATGGAIGTNANFGDKEVTKIIIPGEKGTSITTTPLDVPEKTIEGKYLYLRYVTEDYTHDGGIYKYDTSGSELPYRSNMPYSSNVGDISVFTSDWVKYKYVITLTADGKETGKLYYYGSSNIIKVTDLYDNLVAFESNGKLYSPSAVGLSINYNDYSSDGTHDLESTNAFAMIVDPFKKGAYLDEWQDASGKTMINDVVSNYIYRTNTSATQYVAYQSSYLFFSEISADMTLSAKFSPLTYIISYSGNTAQFTNNVTQKDLKVGETVNLYDVNTFGNNDYFKLLSWNDRPDGKGTSYALGADFVLTGEQFYDMFGTSYSAYSKYSEYNGDISSLANDNPFQLYGIWENTGSGSGSGDSSSGDDNTNTYILIVILVLIIGMIIVIIIIMMTMRRKQ